MLVRLRKETMLKSGSWAPLGSDAWVRLIVFALATLPFCILSVQILNNELGPDPAKRAMHETGEWALRFLILVLLATPLAHYGWVRLSRYRRMLGIFVAFYATLHLLIFAQAYVGWDGEILREELGERPYALVGFLAWVLLVILAITSLNKIRRAMGSYWRGLHQMVYLIAMLVTLHVYWLSRSDVAEALVYAMIFATLLLYRLRRRFLVR